MSILEDLDLLDLLDDLPEGSDFDLNDILFEFSTPGLYSAPIEEEAEEISIPEIVEELPEPVLEVPVEPVIVEEPVCDEIPVVETIEECIADESPEEIPFLFDDVVEADEPETYPIEATEYNDEEALFGDSLGICDILYEFGTPTDDEGVKLYNPNKVDTLETEDDDVKVYAPALESTVLFDATALNEEPAPMQPAEAPATAKAPGLFAKAAAVVMGLFASKKASKTAPQIATPVSEPEEVDMLALFTQDTPAVEELSVLDDTSSAEEIPVFDIGEGMEEISVSEELPVFAFDMEEPVAEEPSVFVADEPETLIEVSAEDSSEAVEDAFNIGDILFELNEDVNLDDLPSDWQVDSLVAEDDEDMKVYSAAEETPAVLDIPEIPALSLDIEEEASPATMVFDALDLSVEPEIPATQPIPVQPKEPGFLAKAAAVVMGVFASKKKSKPVPVVQSAPAPEADVDDPFAHLADLFASEGDADLTGMDELMLELELQAEREAELEAEASTRDAAARLAMEAEQKALELEAQRLAQEEADAEAALQKQLQAEEAERQSLAEDELFEWIEASEKRRQKAAIVEEAPVSKPSTAALDDYASFDIPLMEQPAEESNTPAYDFAAVQLPNETTHSAAPQLEINMEEAPSEEIGDLLEMPDVEKFSTEEEETPEEAAARKKKEDDELHYTPEESTAKTITSHIGKRIGAAFNAVVDSDEDSDREEDLGPELPANKAYRFFHKYINGYRFRLRVSAVLCVILGWISLGLPVFGSLKNPAVASAMCLMILLTVMLAGADILASGVRTLLNRRPGIHSLVALSCFASVIDAVVIIATKGQAGYLPFCGVSAISMCFAIYGSLLYCRSQRLNFKTLDRAVDPMTISVDYGIVDDDTSSVYRTPGHPENYIHHSEEEDLSETIYGIMAPILLPAIPVMTVIAALFSNGFGDFFHIMASMFAAATSFSALIAFPLPYFLVQRDLYATKAAIAGWAGTRELGRVSNMIVSDRDLFPDDTVSIKSVRIVDNVPPQLTLSYMCSLVKRSGSCLVPAFIQLAENNDCDLLDVENFECHEAGGLSGEIGPDSVLVASHSYMKLQGFRIPARKKDSENALFLAVNGHVIAYIIVDYKPIKSVRAGLQSALRGNVEMIFAARDFNVTPLLIAKKFKSATETLRFPSYNQRYEITEQSGSETATCAAVVYRKSFYSYAVVVEKARYLYRSVSSAVVLSAVSSVMGILLMFFMAITGAGAAVTVGRLLIFMLLWLLPTLALSISITK